MMSEAISSAPTIRQRLPLYPTQFLVAMAIVSLGPLLDSIMKEFGVPLSRGGLLSAGLYLGNITAIVILNAAMAHIPTRWTLLAATALQGASLIAAGALSWNLWSLFGIYMVIGFCGALMNTTCWMWLSAHVKRNTAGSALQMILFFAVGMMVIPLIIGLALDRGVMWRWVLITEGGLSLLIAAISFFVPLSDVEGRQNVRLSHLKQVFAYDSKLVAGIMGAGFLYVGAEMTMNIWLPKFEIDVFSATGTWASLTVTLFWVGLIIGRLIMMPLTARFSASRLLLFCGCTFAVFTLALAYAPSQAVSLILAVGAGLGASGSYGLIGSYSGRFPEWQSSVVSSLFIFAGGLGSITFPYILGPLADSGGFRLALAMIAVPAMAYALLSLLIRSRSGEGRRQAHVTGVD